MVREGKAFLLSSILLVSAEAFHPVCRAQSRGEAPPRGDAQAALRAASVTNGTADDKADTATDRATDGSAVKPGAPPGEEDHENSLGLKFIEHLVNDQKSIWTSPGHARLADAEWLVPLGLAVGGMFATDTEFSKHLSNSPRRLRDSKDLSNYGLGSMAAVGGGLYLWGQATHDEHKSETGILAGEAAIDSYAVTSVIEFALGRERPLADGYRGNFGQGGSSFPSEHAAAAWSIASVIAHEYPGPLTEFLAYGAASAVSVSRLTAKQHFPSDVLIGSAIGWLVGREVYRAHHDPALGGGAWETTAETSETEERRPRQKMGTVFVPLDSWVYPALTKLAALGAVHTLMEGLEPWTRMECARQTEEAGEAIAAGRVPAGDAAAIQARLAQEFSRELGLLDGGRNVGFELESVYARGVSISGPPLTDGYHFGQTISYDFGRPFREGMNGQAGGAVSAEAGPLAFYVRSEFQHAPGAPALSDAVRSVIALRDEVPLPPAGPFAGINRPRLLDAYFALNLSNWQITAGKQSVSWGPGPGGSFLWSTNAEPIYMVRIDTNEPIHLPWLLRFLGPTRVDQFIGRLEGHVIVPHPLIYAQKINFRPLPNLELGFGRSTTLGGKGGEPFTPINFLFSAFGQERNNSVPGDSHSGFDWTFNVPKTANYFVFYGEMYADDDFVPFQNPPKNPYRPGIYLTRFPGIPKLDFHVEETSTESPGYRGPDGKSNHGDLNYWNSTYPDGYTNNGNLIGNTVGRMGQAQQAWLTYWVRPQDNFQFIFRNSTVDKAFIPGGGAWRDYAVKSETHFRGGFYVKTEVQCERIARFPVLFAHSEQNVTAIVEAGFMPERKK